MSDISFQVKQIYSKLLQSKQDRWDTQKASLRSSIDSLCKFITALASLPQEGSAPDLTVWFQHLHQLVNSTDTI